MRNEQRPGGTEAIRLTPACARMLSGAPLCPRPRPLHSPSTRCPPVLTTSDRIPAAQALAVCPACAAEGGACSAAAAPDGLSLLRPRPFRPPLPPAALAAAALQLSAFLLSASPASASSLSLEQPAASASASPSLVLRSIFLPQGQAPDLGSWLSSLPFGQQKDAETRARLAAAEIARAASEARPLPLHFWGAPSALAAPTRLGAPSFFCRAHSPSLPARSLPPLPKQGLPEDKLFSILSSALAPIPFHSIPSHSLLINPVAPPPHRTARSRRPSCRYPWPAWTLL